MFFKSTRAWENAGDISWNPSTWWRHPDGAQVLLLRGVNPPQKNARRPERIVRLYNLKQCIGHPGILIFVRLEWRLPLLGWKGIGDLGRRLKKAVCGSRWGNTHSWQVCEPKIKVARSFFSVFHRKCLWVSVEGGVKTEKKWKRYLTLLGRFFGGTAKKSTFQRIQCACVGIMWWLNGVKRRLNPT